MSIYQFVSFNHPHIQCGRFASLTLLGLFTTIVALLLTVVSAPSVGQPLAAEPQAEPVISVEGISPEQQAQIIKRLQQARPQLSFTDLKPSPMPGVYEIKVNGQVAFVSVDGSHLIAGEMYEVQVGSLVNLQEQERQRAEQAFAPERAKVLNDIERGDMVIYTPEKAVKGHIYVFTDIDCGFCRRFHSQLEDMLDKGIEIRYLAFPRAGPYSKSARKLATTWCADNPREIMTRFKNGENMGLSDCMDTPVVDQYMLGQEVGVRGTPAIVLGDGTMIPGAVSADYLVQVMGLAP